MFAVVVVLRFCRLPLGRAPDSRDWWGMKAIEEQKAAVESVTGRVLAFWKDLQQFSPAPPTPVGT